MYGVKSASIFGKTDFCVLVHMLEYSQRASLDMPVTRFVFTESLMSHKIYMFVILEYTQINMRCYVDKFITKCHVDKFLTLVTLGSLRVLVVSDVWTSVVFGFLVEN
jgi:hypothetical protein